MAFNESLYHLSKSEGRRILHVDMDAFYVSVELLKRPELQGKPVIVGGKSPRGVVTTCSYEARRYGIHSAMPSVRALRLCPDAIWINGDYSAYSYYSKEVFNIMRRYSPDVYPLSIDEGRVDLSGSQKLFGPAEEIAHRILEEIRDELGLPASAGLANSGTAAKMAAELAKPKGLIVITPGNEKQFLSPLPIERVPGVGAKSLPRFHEFGIRTIGDLCKYDSRELAKHFGSWGLSLLKIANGNSKPASPHSPVSPSRSNECTFSTNITCTDRIRLETRKLVEKLGYRLRQSQLKTKTVSVKIRDGQFNTITRSRSLDTATNRDSVIFSVAESLILSNIPSRSGIRLLGVSAQNLQSGIRQASLFDVENRKDERFYQTVDSIKNRFGRHAVSFGEPSRSRQSYRQPDHVKAVS